MNRGRLRRICLILLALLLLAVILCTAFALAVRADCCVQACAPCLNLAKLQESLRQFGETFGAITGLLVLLTLFQLMLGELLGKQDTTSLIALKIRLNN